MVHPSAPYCTPPVVPRPDVLLLAGDSALPAHRLVLAASPRFREVGVVGLAGFVAGRLISWAFRPPAAFAPKPGMGGFDTA
jgi:hypothetical protein